MSGIISSDDIFREWVLDNINLILLSIITFFISCSLLLLIIYYTIVVYFKMKYGIHDLNFPEIFAKEVFDILTNRENVSKPSLDDRLRSLSVNIAIYFLRSVALQKYFIVVGGFFTSVLGLLTVFLLNEQNKKIEIQSQQITIQTKQLVAQSQASTAASLLMEGTRRAALASELWSLLEDIRTEANIISENNQGKKFRYCKNDIREACWTEAASRPPDAEIVYLSNKLFERIRGVASLAKPYPSIVKRNKSDLSLSDSIDSQYRILETSPERGQILLTLAQSNVFSVGIDFNSADLSGVQIKNVVFQGDLGEDIKLSGINFEGAELINCNFSHAILNRGKLNNADFSKTSFNRSDFSESDMSNSNFFESSFAQAILTDTNFEGAKLENASFGTSSLRRTNFKNADLRQADFTLAYVVDAIFTNADLEGADFEQLSELNGEIDNNSELYEKLLGQIFGLAKNLDKAKLPAGFSAICYGEVISGKCNNERGWSVARPLKQ